MSIPELARAVGIPSSTIYSRLKRHWPIDVALTTPPWGQERARAERERRVAKYRRPVNKVISKRLRQLFLWRLGLLCENEMIEDVLWGDDPGGGPLNIENSIKVYVHQLRLLGWKIGTHWGRGYICYEAGR